MAHRHRTVMGDDPLDSIIGNVLVTERDSRIPPPLSAEEHYNLGKILHDNGETNQAIEQFRKAARLAPESPAPHFSLGICLRQQGRPKEAIEALGVFLGLSFDSPAHDMWSRQAADLIREMVRSSPT